jgi:hypothetical protein
MKNLNPDKKIFYILNKYGYKKDVKTSRVCRDTDYYSKGTVENNDLEIAVVRRYNVFKLSEVLDYWQEIIMVTFDNCYLMDVGKAAFIWKGSYNWVGCCKDYFNVETMAWDISAKYREIIENISTRLYKLK